MSRTVDVEVTNPRVADAGHVEYEVAFDLSEAAQASAKAVRVRWAVKKRYSDFTALDAQLRSHNPVQMSAIKLPPKKMFGSKDPGFIRERQRDLQAYMHAVLHVHGFLDFESHLGCPALRAFMDWDSRHARNVLAVAAAPAPPASTSGASATPTAGPAAPRDYSRHRSRATLAGSSASVLSAAAAPGYTSMLAVTPDSSVYSKVSTPSSTPSTPAAAQPVDAVTAALASAGISVPAPAPAPAAAAPVAPRAAAAPVTAPAPAPVPAAAAAAAAPRPALAAGPAAAGARPGPPPAAGLPPPPRPPAGPPAPPAGGSLPPPADGARGALLASIQGGAKLKKAKTNDRSAPKVSGKVK